MRVLSVNPLLLLLSIFFAMQVLASTSPAQVDSSESNLEAVARLRSEADQAMRQRNYELSLKKYTEAIQRGSTRATVAYNAACSAAKMARRDDAFRFLDLAVDFGWLDLELLNQDADLESLRADPRWQQLKKDLIISIEQNNVLWKSPAFNSKYQQNLSDAEKAAGLSKLWAEVKFNFVNFDQVPTLDWDAEFVAFMPKVLKTQSTLEYYRLLEQFVAKLNDAHTNVYLPPNLSSKFNARPALKTELIEDQVIVTKVLDQAVKALGIEVGQELIAINDQPVHRYADQFVKPFVAASTPQDRATRVYGDALLRGPVTDSVSLELKRIDGQTFNVTVARTLGVSQIARFFSRPAAFELKMLQGNIAYVKLNSFSSSAALKQFQSSFSKIEKADALILDLRSNGGGNSGVGWNILGHLTDEPFATTRWHMYQYRPTLRAWGRHPQVKQESAAGMFSVNREHHYDKPVAMLIGPRTFSAAEDMVVAFDILDRGPIIGQPSGGSTGQPLMFDLPGGGRARVCTKHDRYADGTKFVGVGVQPDRLVKPTVEDFRSGIDRTLETAKETLLEQIEN
ncbi:MAG: S41 family peptidase [Planctomycetota bacterium]